MEHARHRVGDGEGEAVAAAFERGLGRPADSELVELLTDAFEEACASWSGIEVDATTFAQRVGASLSCADEAARGLAELNTKDLYLALACGSGCPEAIEAFQDTFRGVIRGALDRPQAMGVDREDLEQLLLERLLVRRGGKPARIEEYEGRSSLATWLRIIATRIALDHQRRKIDRATDLDEPERLDVGLDPELLYLEEHYRDAFAMAFRAALAGLTSRQRNVLRYVSQGLSATRVAQMYRVDRSTSKRWIAAARSKLLADTRAALARKLDIQTRTLDSIMRMVRGSLAVTLARAFAEAEAPR